MEVCAELFRTLQNPHLVARFQKLCGVEGHTMVEKSLRAPTKSADCSKVDEQNNCSECFQSGQSHYPCETNGIDHVSYPNGIVKTSNTVVRRHVNGNHSHTAECEHYRNGSIDGTEVKESDLPEADLNQFKNEDEELTHGELTEDVTNILEPEHWTNFEYDYSVKYSFIYYMFKLASGVGNETFFTLVFPYVIWNMDSLIGRQMSVVWFYIMFIGQATKDLIKLPRPASPPVVRLEKRYEYEYGMPSTHAMIGVAFPFGMLTLMQWRYPGEFSFGWGLVTAVIWMVLVAASRLYMGMHTVMDVLAGLAYSCVILPPLLPVLGNIDRFSIMTWYSPLVIVPLTVGFCLAYPKLDRWSTTRGDTTVVMSTSIGILLATWFDFQMGRYDMNQQTGPPYSLNLFDIHSIYMGILRFLIGSVLIIAIRQFLKPLVLRGVCFVNGVEASNVKALQQLRVELPYKYITYCSLAFFAISISGNMFSYLGIERATYLQEIL